MAPSCPLNKHLTLNQREFLAYEMMTAGEAAHWAHDDARARTLVERAHKMMHALDGPTRGDRDVKPFLYGDEAQSESDLAGSWTIGVR